MNRQVVRFLIMTLFSFYSVPSMAQSEGVFTDERDGRQYKTVTYQLKVEPDSKQEVTWMAQNLSFQSPNSQCFANKEANCEANGRLYNWFEAMKVCPVGWHLPSDKEWYQLAALYGGTAKAGKHLKADKKVWPQGKGTNKSKFNGLPTGSSDPNGFYNERAGFFWSATLSETDPNEASDWSFVPWLTELRHWYGVKYIGNAVRCVKDQ